MSMPTIVSTGDTVVLSNGDLTLTFDRRYGGAPLTWVNSRGVTLTNPFPGEGFQMTYDTGNDGTWASSDGLTQNQIARLFQPASDRYAYYLSETSIGRAWNGIPIAHYQASGVIPMFWASLDKIDDSVPPDPRGPNPWNTIYNNFLNLPASVFSNWGVPLIFSPRGAVTSGIILIGDEIKNFYYPNTPWNQAYTKMKNGRFAFRFRVSLKQASGDGLAGLVIRKQVPTAPNADVHALYAAPGYQLNFNKQGAVQFVKDNFTPLWTSPKSYSSQLNSTNGLKVELRTRYDNSQIIDLYLEDVLVTTLSGLTYTHEAFGFFAQASAGQVWITYREPFDLNVVMTAAWFAYSNRITSVLGISAEDLPMYRIAAPVAFLATPIRQMWEFQDNNNVIWNNTQNPPFQIVPTVFPVDRVKSFWVGKSDHLSGIAGAIESCPADGHLGLSDWTFTLNPLPYNANFAPVTMGEKETVVHWRSTPWWIK